VRKKQKRRIESAEGGVLVGDKGMGFYEKEGKMQLRRGKNNM